MAIIEAGVVPSPETGRSAWSARVGVRAGGLRRRLLVRDIAGTSASWAGALVLAEPDATPWVLAAIFGGVVLATAVALRVEHLYLARVAAVRADELSRLARVSCLSGVAAWLLSSAAHVDVRSSAYVVGAAATFVVLAHLRGRYGHWVRAQRSMGLYTRPVVLVGSSGETAPLAAFFLDEPELGFTPVGFVGPIDVDGAVPEISCLGDLDDAIEAVERTGATGVVVAATALRSAELNQLVRDLHAAGVHVQVFSGITGLSHRRLRVQPMSHEPLIYVEPASLSRRQLALKRALDVVGAVALLLVLAPVMVVTALAIKLDDGGPVFFRQERVGRGGTRFTIWKFRTMCVDAEQQLTALRPRNEREGPLFKMSDDPRVTRVGRFLRSSSIDEIPQLLNALDGSMSLVGPRPALACEVAAYDVRLSERLRVKPGVTGLWQVEARDRASFESYRRLDLYYVDNWSVWLDLAVLLRTVGAVLSRVRDASIRSSRAAHVEVQP